MFDIKFNCIVKGNDGSIMTTFTEWLDGDGWKHDFYSPLVSNGVFNHEELGDGFLGDIIRRRFTGLLDKNKEEIYEGDICKRYYLQGIVAYHTKRAMFIIQDGFNEPLFQEIYGVEKIGDTHANHELIKKSE